MTTEASSRNVLRRIEDLTNRIAKDYSNIHVVPRGAPVFLDENLRGTIRFAQRQGNFLPVISPRNATELAANVTPPTNVITVTRISKGFTVFGAIVSLGPGRELAKISDVDTETLQIITEDDLLGAHAEGETIALYGVPIEVIGDQPQDDTVIQVRSTEKIFIGDQIAIDTTKGLLNSTVSTLVVDVLFLGTTLDGRSNYELTLDRGISRSLSDEEDISLRAQPGYGSLVSKVTRVDGPFVIDYISGPFFEETEIDEYLGIQLFDSLGGPLAGFDRPVLVLKNYPVVATPIRADSMLFWDVIQGTIQFRDGRFVAITDGQGRFVLSTELIPGFPAGQEWEIPVRSDSPTRLRVRFAPNEFRDFSLSSGILSRVTVGLEASAQEGSRLEIVCVAQSPGGQVEFNNWLPVQSAVSSMVYQVTSTALDNVWQAGSLMLKPYFLTLKDITARMDFSAYDNGVVHF